jgi:DNA-directed RNA polymerase subunit K/omega
MSTQKEPIDNELDLSLENDVPDDDIDEVDVKSSIDKSVVSHKETLSELNKTTSKKIQYPFILANEEAKIIGLRAQQLANGAPALVDTTGMTCVIKIAKKELKEGVNPFVIRRTFPDGTYIDLKVNELRM